MATRRVLIVDDEADVRKTLAEILRALRYPDGLEIEEAPDGQQIHQVEPRLPVIVITATPDTTMAAAALRDGAVAYLPKPFDPRHVQMLVTTFLDSTKRRATKPPEGAR